MRYILLLFMLAVSTAMADNYRHHPVNIQIEPVVVPVTLDVNEVTHVTEVTETIEFPGYNIDKCQGVAIAMAAANNHMYMGTSKPQVSAGVGYCENNWATSIMFGKRLSNNTMLSGNVAFDEDVTAGGGNFHFVFP